MPSLRTLIESNNCSTSKAQIVRECNFYAWHLPLASLATELPSHLATLREPCRAERVALRNEAAARVNNSALAAIVVITTIHIGTSLALWAETQSLVSNELVR